MPEYVLPKELSKQHSISLKTVYNYLSKHPDKIRTKKEFWKRFVHFEDFTTILQKSFQYYNPKATKTEETQVESSNWNKIETDSTLPNEYALIAVDNEKLKNRNDVLERQIKRYAQLHTEERAEKKEILDKFEMLQNEFKSEIQKYSSDKINMTRMYFRLLLLCVICLLIMVTFVTPNILSRMFNI